MRFDPLSRRTFGVLLLATGATAAAQTWPAKPLTLVVPFPAGGGTDIVVRAIQPMLQQALGQPIVIDNRGGAGGTIGSNVVAKAAPDGYVLGIATTSTHAVSVGVSRNLPYDPLKDFAYAGFIGTSPYVLAVNAGVPAADVKALVATMRKNPQHFSFASVGAGTVSHLIGEQFKAYSGVPLVHVPYRGASPAYTDLIGGQVQLMFDNPVGLASYFRAGKLQAVATTGSNALLAGVPTFAQQGVPNFAQSLWYGVVFPKGTPQPIVQKFNEALNKVLTDRAVAADLASKGVNARPGPAADLQATVAKDIPYWGQVARAVGATVD